MTLQEIFAQWGCFRNDDIVQAVTSRAESVSKDSQAEQFEDRNDLVPSRLCSSATSQSFIHHGAFSLAMLIANCRDRWFSEGPHSVHFNNMFLQVSQ